MKKLNKLYRKVKNLKSAYLEFKNITQYDLDENDSSKNSLIIELSDPALFNRYFYNLLKFFKICGYVIYWPGFNFKNYRKNYYQKNTIPQITLISFFKKILSPSKENLALAIKK